MASQDLTITINESVLIGNTYRESNVQRIVKAVTGTDNRVMTIPSGSLVELLKFTGSLDSASAGTVPSPNLVYLRVSNTSITGSLYLTMIGATTGSNTIKLDPYESHMITSTFLSGSLDQLSSIKAFVSGSVTGSRDLEFYLATR